MADEALMPYGKESAEKAANAPPEQTPGKSRRNSGKESPDRSRKGYDARNDITQKKVDKA